MTTWKLWRGLNHPPVRHPLFQHTLLRQTPITLDREITRPVGMLLIGLIFACALFPATMLGLFIAVMVIVSLFTVLNGTLYGVRWAVLIGETIVREKELGTYDLLSLLPVGALGARWLLAAGCLHRQRGLQRNHQLLTAILVVALITLVMIVGVVLLSLNLQRARSAENREVLQMVLTVVSAAILIAAIYVDHVQSVVLSGLVGMLTPNYTRQRIDARVWATGGFLLGQFTTYLLAWGIGIMLLPIIFETLGIRGAYTDVGLAVLRLAVFYAVREGMIALAWRVLTDQLNADRREVDLLIQAKS